MPSQPQVQQQRFPPPVQQGVIPNQMSQPGPQQQRPQGPPNPQQYQQQRPQNPNPIPNPIVNRGPPPQQMQSQQQPQQQQQVPQNRPPVPQPQPQSYQLNQQPTLQSNSQQPNPQQTNIQQQNPQQPNPQQTNIQQPIQRPPLIRPQQAPPNFNTQQAQQNNQPLQQQNNQPQSQNIAPQQPQQPYRQPMPQQTAQQRPIGPNTTISRPPMSQYGQQPQSQPYSQSQPPPNQLRSQNSLERIQRPIDSTDIISARAEQSRPNSVLSNKSDEDYRAPMPKPIQPSVQQSTIPNSYQQHPALQRTDSRNSIPSRPQSSLEHQSKSPSPDYMVKPMESKPVENNLPKIPENVGRNAYESREIREPVSVQRPPSVTFKEDIKKYPIESRTNEPIKSPISLNTIINNDSATSPGYKQRDFERTTTPTSEKFRAMPGLTQERPPAYLNGGDSMRLKSSLKYSKKLKMNFFVTICQFSYITNIDLP